MDREKKGSACSEPQECSLRKQKVLQDWRTRKFWIQHDAAFSKPSAYCQCGRESCSSQSISLLEKILQPCPSFFQKLGPEFGYDALGWQAGHCCIEIRKRLHQPLAQSVKLGIALPNIHVASLHRYCQYPPTFSFSPAIRVRGGAARASAVRTWRVSTRTFHTTKAPMLVAPPLTIVWPTISTLLAQQALLRSSSSSSASLSSNSMAPDGCPESDDCVEAARRREGIFCQYGGAVNGVSEGADESIPFVVSLSRPFRPPVLRSPPSRRELGAAPLPLPACPPPCVSVSPEPNVWPVAATALAPAPA